MKPYAAEKARADAFEGDVDTGSQRGERHMRRTAAAVREMRHEQGFARDDPLAGAQQIAEKAAVRVRAVSELRLERYAIFHVGQGTRLGDDRFAGVEIHLHQLLVVTENRVVNFVALFAHHRFSMFQEQSVQNRFARQRIP